MSVIFFFTISFLDLAGLKLAFLMHCTSETRFWSYLLSNYKFNEKSRFAVFCHKWWAKKNSRIISTFKSKFLCTPSSAGLSSKGQNSSCWGSWAQLRLYQDCMSILSLCWNLKVLTSIAPNKQIFLKKIITPAKFQNHHK